MEAQAALVRADGAVHLNAESAIDLDFALIIEPRNAEHDDALGFDDALENARRPDIRDAAASTSRRESKTSCNGLVEFGLGGILGLHLRHDLFNVIARDSGFGRRQRTCTHIDILLDL